MSKADAYEFFTQLEAHLNSKMPTPEITRAEIKTAKAPRFWIASGIALLQKARF